MNKVKFFKFHASGNDFIVVRKEDVEKNFDLMDLTLRMCDRHFGAGADGLLVVGKEDNVCSFRIFNNDGTEAEISGNGLANAGAYVFLYVAKNQSEILFHTKVGKRNVRKLSQNGNKLKVQIDMGEPKFDSDSIPFNDGASYEKIVDYPLSIGQRVFHVTILSVGNPHTIIFMENFPSSFEIRQIGREIESHPFFPNHTNVEFVKIINDEEIEVLFYERGVGETLSSGSGSSAAVVASVIKGFTKGSVKVRTKAGTLNVTYKEGRVFVENESTHTYVGEFFL